MRYFRGNELDITAKLNDADIVAAADKAAERLIIDSIRRKYPDHSISRRNRVRLCRPRDSRWVIDPLDGTTNFSQGLPIFSVSIGVEYEGTPGGGKWSTTHISTRCSTPWRAPEHFSAATPYIAPKRVRLTTLWCRQDFPVDKGGRPTTISTSVAHNAPKCAGCGDSGRRPWTCFMWRRISRRLLGTQRSTAGT